MCPTRQRADSGGESIHPLACASGWNVHAKREPPGAGRPSCRWPGASMMVLAAHGLDHVAAALLAALHAVAQAFIISSPLAVPHSSAHRRQASAQARQDSIIRELCREIMAAERVQNAAQSTTNCAILACSALPAAAWLMQWWNAALHAASQCPHASSHSLSIASCRGSCPACFSPTGRLIVAGLRAIGHQGEAGRAGSQHAEHLTSLPHGPISFGLSTVSWTRTHGMKGRGK